MALLWNNVIDFYVLCSVSYVIPAKAGISPKKT